jgi:hypothetical protein
MISNEWLCRRKLAMIVGSMCTAIATALPTVAAAESSTTSIVNGHTLLSNCRDMLFVEASGEKVPAFSKRGIELLSCSALIQVSGLSSNLLRDLADKQPKYCVPKEVSINDKARIVVRYLEAHPEKLDDNSTGLIEAALSEAYPCPKQRERYGQSTVPAQFQGNWCRVDQQRDEAIFAVGSCSKKGRHGKSDGDLTISENSFRQHEMQCKVLNSRPSDSDEVLLHMACALDGDKAEMVVGFKLEDGGKRLRMWDMKR